MDEGNQFLGLLEAAKWLKISHVTLRKMIAAGKVPSYRDGLHERRVLLRVEDLERLREPQLRTPQEELAA